MVGLFFVETLLIYIDLCYVDDHPDDEEKAYGASEGGGSWVIGEERHAQEKQEGSQANDGHNSADNSDEARHEKLLDYLMYAVSKNCLTAR